MEFKRKGWKNPGYHYVVSADGVVHQMLDEERVSNGVKGWNSKLINVAYIGGIDATGKATDNRTEAQKKSLKALLKLLRSRYPKATIQGLFARSERRRKDNQKRMDKGVSVF